MWKKNFVKKFNIVIVLECVVATCLHRRYDIRDEIVAELIRSKVIVLDESHQHREEEEKKCFLQRFYGYYSSAVSCTIL